jgi:PAS domain S-box-containing protein
VHESVSGETRQLGSKTTSHTVTANRSRKRSWYQNILETSLDSFWIIDGNGQFLDVNPAFCRLLGCERHELLKKGIKDVELNESASEVFLHIQKISKIGNDQFETRMRRADG